MQVATAAAHVIRVMTAESETMSQLQQAQTSLMPALIKLAVSEDVISCTYALEALVNLAQVDKPTKLAQLAKKAFIHNQQRI